MKGYLNTFNKEECSGCNACAQICPKDAISLVEDEEGFKYPVIDEEKCVKCGLCHKVCQYEEPIKKYNDEKQAFGGYNSDWQARVNSTSGGAFSAIVEAYCNEDYAIFGATSEGLNIYHTYILDKSDIDNLRKSKYSQSDINDMYNRVKEYLKNNMKVVFSGTPCQIAGLKKYLMNDNTDNLLTVEVVCEGVPSPLYMHKFEEYLFKKYSSKIRNLDYRYKDSKKENHGKWDFEVMRIELENGKVLKKDRWFNPYWNIWLNHLMNRPSCYKCLYTTPNRVADITLGDLWGVHLYCPELYGNNGGSSLVIANNEKGKEVLEIAKQYMYGHDLDFETALKYQKPLRECISSNENRDSFLNDLKDTNMSYKDIVDKWYEKPTTKLLWSKYVWGNRQKVLVYNIKKSLKRSNNKHD